MIKLFFYSLTWATPKNPPGNDSLWRRLVDAPWSVLLMPASVSLFFLNRYLLLTFRRPVDGIELCGATGVINSETIVINPRWLGSSGFGKAVLRRALLRRPPVLLFFWRWNLYLIWGRLRQFRCSIYVEYIKVMGVR